MNKVKKKQELNNRDKLLLLLALFNTSVNDKDWLKKVKELRETLLEKNNG